MKIVHIATFLQGGAGRVIVDLIAAQQRQQHDVALVASLTSASEPGYGHYDAYLDELRAMGVPMMLVDSTFSREPSANLAVVRALDDAWPRGEEPQVLHAHAGVPSLVALQFAGARRYPCAIVQTMHGWGVRKSEAQAAADVAAMNLVDRVAVPSRHSADLMTSLGVADDRVRVIPYGIDRPADALDAAEVSTLHSIETARRAGTFVVACVGTIGARKNQALLIETLAQLTREMPILALFIGDGHVEGLQMAIDAAGVADRARVLGYRAGARRLAAATDALVLPSTSEGQPLAILEAFQDGTLVVASDIPELAELVTHGKTGLTFERGNPSALAATLEQLAALPEAVRRAMRNRARARHAQQFTTAAMARRYDDLYQGVLSAGAGAVRPRVWPAA
jgi:glycosyltransferase involved in cell wall biosynthesis